MQDHHTLRQLWWYAYGAWLPTTHVLATLANTNRDPKKNPRAVQPRDCHPLEPRRGGARGFKLHRGNFGILKAAFVGKRSDS